MKMQHKQRNRAGIGNRVVIVALALAVPYSSALAQEWISGVVREGVEGGCRVLLDDGTDITFELYGEAIADVPADTRLRVWGFRRDWTTFCMQGQPFEAVAVEPAAGTGQANRSLPEEFSPGATVPVCIDIVATAETTAVGVEDRPPTGWTVSSIDRNGAWDVNSLKVKWGPFFAPIPASVCYIAHAPAEAAGEHCFVGTVSFDGINSPVGGNQCTHAATSACPYPPAPSGSDDCNDNGVADECDLDVDGDLVPDDCDNCAELANDQRDFDLDGFGDACDPDIDDDGVANPFDGCDFTPLSVPQENVQADGTLRGDLDGDCDVDLEDHRMLLECFTGPGTYVVSQP